MNSLLPHLLKRRKYLENLMTEISCQRENLPDGHLRLKNDKGIPRYYHITVSGDTKGKYLSKKEQDLARKLAQKDYVNKLYLEVEKELRDIDVYLRRHTKFDLENVYHDLNHYRKNLVEPIVVPDNMFAERWQKEDYVTNPFAPEEKVYLTKREELVRSKSEVMLADMYYEMGIPYRYEAQITLKNGKRKYPDFTLLKTKTREIIYHEHLGLMDNEQYLQANLVKMDEYRKSGIYPGKNLIITYEGAGTFLNIKEIKEMIRDLWDQP